MSLPERILLSLEKLSLMLQFLHSTSKRGSGCAHEIRPCLTLKRACG